MNVKNLLRAIPLCAATLIVGCSSTPKEPERARIVHEVTAEASVRAVDAATRMVELERADGTRILVIAGPEVRNFDQIEVGDTVTARYTETMSARKLAQGEVAQEPEILLAAGAAEAGARPGASIGAGLALVVTVESLDFNENLVVFTDPSGALHAVRPETGTGRTFIKKLKVGDRVELMFTEQVMLAVEE